MTDLRRIDGMGRLVLPLEMRAALGLAEGVQVKITLCDGVIVIQRVEEQPGRIQTSGGRFYFSPKGEY